MLRVLAYHTVNDQTNFESQIQYLKSNYSLITVCELENFLFKNTKLPKKPLLITFDDGDYSLYANAFPVLKKYNVPAIIFVITNLINTYEPFWWNEVYSALGNKQGHNEVLRLKKIPNNERVTYMKRLRASQSTNFIQKQLSTNELIEMSGKDVCIANHSHSHPIFDKCESHTLKNEMINSIKFLRAHSFSPFFFAYPNGNFSEEAETVLKGVGVKLSFLFDHKINYGKINPLRISRLVVNDSTPLWKLKLILSGWHSRILPLTKLLGKLRK
ncbi:MAG: polysaccharide deacetylase family protein [Christiangramia sp.]|uniref:polysaccharide deacetylase family protein n=1 Tax=Christiangramia sp. TaxID=1931228 RepID=UPI003242D2BF